MSEASDGAIYEGVHVSLVPAPIWKRTLAYSVDMAIVTCVIYALVIVAAIAGGLSAAFVAALIKGTGAGKGLSFGIIFIMAVFLLVILAFYHGYFVYYESKKGFTPGKKLFGLQVVSLKGSRLTTGQCFLRDMMRYVDAMMILPGLFAMLLTEKSQRLGDLMAGTLVVHSQHQESASNFLYMKQDDYLYYREKWNVTIVPLDIARRYLEFAYPVFCQGLELRDYNLLDQWQQVSLNYVHPSGPEPIEQMTLLTFFAELCFQTVQESQRRKP